MNLFNRIFGSSKSQEEEALQALEDLERLAEHDSPLDAMEFMATLNKRYSSMLGPSGPLHSRFIACLDKLKAKADDRVYGRVPITDEEMARIVKGLKKMHKWA